MSQIKVITLNNSIREALKKMQKRASAKGKKRILHRIEAVLMADGGASIEEIMDNLGIKTKPTVQRCLDKFREKGMEGLYDRPHPMPPSRLTPEQKEELLKRRTDLPRIWGGKMGLKDWSYRGLSHWVEKQWGVTLSYERIRQIFQRANETDWLTCHPPAKG
jgi:transposase